VVTHVSAGRETVIYRFTGKNDGGHPSGGLLYDYGSLYGTTSLGGKRDFGTTFTGGAGAGCPTAGCGTIFKITLR
jgi:hypothetical protein